MNLERLDIRYLPLKVRYGGSFTRYCDAGEAEREELKLWKQNTTPLLVEKLVGYVIGRDKIEGEML
jgi:macrodomain Ter protein organizer (MatP/YcbG family)